MKVAIISSASFQKINFAKLIPQNTTKVISSVPEHLNQSIVQYADVNRIRFVTKNLAECENKWQAIEQFCEQCDHIIALWDGQPDIVKEVIDYAVGHHKSISFFELDSLLYTEKLDNLGRVMLPSTIRQKLGNPDEFSLELEGTRMILHPLDKKCVFCSQVEQLNHMIIHHKSVCICESCLTCNQLDQSKVNQTEENGVFGRRFYFNTNDCNFVPFVLDIYIFNNTNADYIVIYINIE